MDLSDFRHSLRSFTVYSRFFSQEAEPATSHYVPKRHLPIPSINLTLFSPWRCRRSASLLCPRCTAPFPFPFILRAQRHYRDNDANLALSVFPAQYLVCHPRLQVSISIQAVILCCSLLQIEGRDKGSLRHWISFWASMTTNAAIPHPRECTASQHARTTASSLKGRETVSCSSAPCSEGGMDNEKAEVVPPLTSMAEVPMYSFHAPDRQGVLVCWPSGLLAIKGTGQRAGVRQQSSTVPTTGAGPDYAPKPGTLGRALHVVAR
ncbi:hypothetical protein B0H66DRAFT_124430 [Apodospora peruviana]|uniref:Uncharacterized protein n=1 Tax=Apodospora peruviana TaxID=516989 RepID=A0AAE0IHZ8_9PEZI|nr:hypothetical protein B0H66DRAFT_124430 [Apodospora peruviana]